ncbi:Fe-S protein assembly co-chaperone HscB [Wolbachia endosymbiont of Pentidionis agamae]|uniref:Fe-S protein assembly co-chaperone HscB n=1 Tax=Wolbachia endosymbiont of Pentidionis agamae TaxID=3110435 RepID=UPI002FD75910
MVQVKILNSDYFLLLGVEKVFHVDLELLEGNYIKLSKGFHPDLYYLKKEKFIASENMAYIHRAYRVLKSPLERAEYLFQIFGVKDINNRLCPEILSESMEIRESILHSKTLDSTNRIINKKIKDCTEDLSNAFDTKNLDKAVQHYLRLKYLDKALKEVQEDAANTNF